jgi:hypothetical protein
VRAQWVLQDPGAVETACRACRTWKTRFEDLTADGDKVAYRATWSASHTGDLMGIPPTGKRVTVTEMHIARVENGKIVIPLSLLLEKKMLEFEYGSRTTIVPLLAYISNEGKLVTSIRFCEPCTSKSFEIDGMDLVCGNCGTRWKLDNLRGISGNCQKYPPSPIPSQIIGNEIQISEDLVANWKLRI